MSAEHATRLRQKRRFGARLQVAEVLEVDVGVRGLSRLLSRLLSRHRQRRRNHRHTASAAHYHIGSVCPYCTGGTDDCA